MHYLVLSERSKWLLFGSAAVVAGTLLAFTPPLVAVVWLIALAAIGLFLTDPVWPVGFAILSVPAQQLILLPGGISLTQLCFIMLALSLLIRQPRPWPALGAPGWALAGLIWTLALSAAFTPLSRSEGLKETLRWGTVLLVYVATVWLCQDQSRLAWRRAVLITCLLAAPALTALIGIGQFVSGIGPESFAIGGGRVRAYGTIGQPNSFAGYLNQAWPLAIGIVLAAGEAGNWRNRRRWLTLLVVMIAAGCLLGGLLATFSRGGWLGALVGALTMAIAFVSRYGRQVLPRLAFALALAGIGGLLLLNSGLAPAALTNRVNSILTNLRPFDVRGVKITPENFAVVERMAHLQAAWHIIQERPWLGMGPGNFSLAYERLVYSGQSPTWIKPWYDSRGHAHNYYLHIGAEAGALGLIAYLGFLGSVWYTGLQAIQSARDWFTRSIALGGIGVIGAVTGHNLFENLHVLNMGVQFGAIIALLVGIRLNHSPQHTREEAL